MTDKPHGPAISQEEVQHATDEFKRWITTLPEDQQRVFGWILTRAATADNAQAAEFGLHSANNVDISALMAEAAGLKEQETADVAGYMMPDIDPVTVWTFRF